MRIKFQQKVAFFFCRSACAASVFWSKRGCDQQGQTHATLNPGQKSLPLSMVVFSIPEYYMFSNNLYDKQRKSLCLLLRRLALFIAKAALSLRFNIYALVLSMIFKHRDWESFTWFGFPFCIGNFLFNFKCGCGAPHLQRRHWTAESFYLRGHVAGTGWAGWEMSAWHGLLNSSHNWRKWSQFRQNCRSELMVFLYMCCVCLLLLGWNSCPERNANQELFEIVFASVDVFPYLIDFIWLDELAL